MQWMNETHACMVWNKMTWDVSEWMKLMKWIETKWSEMYGIVFLKVHVNDNEFQRKEKKRKKTKLSNIQIISNQ